MKKYRPELTEQELKELERLSKLDFSDFSESDVREEFLVEILKILGYRKEFDYSISREESYSLHPLFSSIGSSRIRLDYLCSLRKKYFWLIDAKKGKCTDKRYPPKIEVSEIHQAYFYSLHPEINCPYFIVSNGWYTNLYNRDSLDQDCNPLLSIKCSEIHDRFLELDNYVGSTQILPYLKREILNVIEKTLSVEIRIDRLDEFINEVEKSVAKIRPIVNKNSLELHNEQIHKGTPKEEELKNDDLYRLIYDVFQTPLNKVLLDHYSKIIFTRLTTDQKWGTQYLFFNKLLLKEAYCVYHRYYSAVLYFLLHLKKMNFVPTNHPPFSSLDDILQEWIDLCILGFKGRKDLHVMISFEMLFYRFGKRIFILSSKSRKSIQTRVQFEEFYFPEERITHHGPNEGATLIEMITKFVQCNLEFIFIRYEDKKSRGLKAQLALQEFIEIRKLVEAIELETENEFKSIQEELGSAWSELFHYHEYGRNFDILGASICDVLLWHKDVSIQFIKDDHKEKIKLMAELGITTFADELLEELGIQWDRNYKKRSDINELRTNYFDPTNYYKSLTNKTKDFEMNIFDKIKGIFGVS